MAKTKFNDLSDKERREYLGDLYQAILSLETIQEVKNFLKDLFSPSEIVIICKRIQIAKRLMRNWKYKDIVLALRTANNTISTVEKWLNYGFGGYKKTLKKLDRLLQKPSLDGDFPESFSTLKKNHPAHFWLLDNLFNDKKKGQDKEGD